MIIDEAIDSPLRDIEQIVETKLDLTAEELVLADKIMPHVKALVRPDVRRELEVVFIKRQQEFEAKLTKLNAEQIDKAMGDWKNEHKPLDDKEIAQLLNKEYAQFTVVIPMRSGGTKEFTLVELPLDIENKVIKLLQKKLIPLLKELIAAEFKLDLESSNVEKFESLLRGSAEILEVVADIVAIIFDPWGEDDKVDSTWVKRNMSASRVLAVLIAQIDLNRYRDFFLNGFRLSKSLRQTQ